MSISMAKLLGQLINFSANYQLHGVGSSGPLQCFRVNKRRYARVVQRFECGIDPGIT